MKKLYRIKDIPDIIEGYRGKVCTIIRVEYSDDDKTIVKIKLQCSKEELNKRRLKQLLNANLDDLEPIKMKNNYYTYE